ncbi:MAG: hypothetical protein AAGC81_17845 [Pseudomonadota bacterium]
MTTASQPGLPWRVLSAWGDLRASMRSLIASGVTEARLLVIAMLSGLIWFLQEVMLYRLGEAGQGLVGDEVSAYFAAQFMAAIFFRTLMLYGVAGLFGLVLRKLGGQGSWVDTRAALFWAFLVTAPVRLALTLLSTTIPGEQLSLIVAQTGPVLLAVVLSIFLAEVNKMKTWSIFAGIAGISLVAIGLTALIPQVS